MFTDNAEDNENCPLDSASTDEKVNYLLDVVEDQQETIRQQQEQIEDLREEVEQLRADEDHTDEQEDRKTLRDEVEELTHRVDAIKGGLSEAHSKLEVIENGPNPDDDATGLEPQTPLEDMVTVPEHLLDHENPKRARFVAKDIRQYSRSFPDGRGLKAGEIRRIISAREEGRTHTETVNRVIQSLDEMGQDEVKVGTTPGSDERVVVFSDETVARIERLQSGHSVVSQDQEGTGSTV